MKILNAPPTKIVETPFQEYRDGYELNLKILFRPEESADVVKYITSLTTGGQALGGLLAGVQGVMGIFKKG